MKFDLSVGNLPAWFVNKLSKVFVPKVRHDLIGHFMIQMRTFLVSEKTSKSMYKIR